MPCIPVTLCHCLRITFAIRSNVHTFLSVADNKDSPIQTFAVVPGEKAPLLNTILSLANLSRIEGFFLTSPAPALWTFARSVDCASSSGNGRSGQYGILPSLLERIFSCSSSAESLLVNRKRPKALCNTKRPNIHSEGLRFSCFG